MKTALPARLRFVDGIMLLEALVYISVLAIVLGCGTALLYQSWGNNIALRRTTDGIISALNAGELWRADIRSATGSIETTALELRIPTTNGVVTYSFSTNVVRRQSPNQPVRTLANVKSSQMSADTRGQIPAWRWEVELNSNQKKIQLRPLFTFEAVASHGGKQ
jgi:hypothetical protein